MCMIYIQMLKRAILVGAVIGLSTVPKDNQSNELVLIIWIQWDHSKSRAALTEGVDQYEIIEKVREYNGA
jgi:hypothetical protein